MHWNGARLNFVCSRWRHLSPFLSSLSRPLVGIFLFVPPKQVDTERPDLYFLKVLFTIEIKTCSFSVLFCVLLKLGEFSFPIYNFPLCI